MRLLIQRVARAAVRVNGSVIGTIGPGLLCFVAIRTGDSRVEAQWIVDKACQLRIFSDDAGKMNLSVEDVGGSVLVVSQFTLYGDAHKGNRPNFLASAPPEQAAELYQVVLNLFTSRLGSDRVQSGQFQAEMAVELENSGPVTILLEREAST